MIRWSTILLGVAALTLTSYAFWQYVILGNP